MEKGNIIQSSINEVLHNSMMPYAEHVILDRALPRVEDGLKPVQRRILYAMYEMGLSPDKPHRKCAKIVGDVLGKYHPHGDSSVYDAMVRMAQNFNMRMPLVNGHGNFGTVDGDGAAAYRYTEARLEELAFELLRDIDKETVNFNLNFDDTVFEPETLPGRYPNLLVNGSSGIAVGLATNIPPHNLGEVIDGAVKFIENPKITLKEMMKYIKGPDFPTGGYIIAGEELVEAYETGRAKIKIRAKASIEKEGEKENIVITEIPYQVNKASLLKKIVELGEEKSDIFGEIANVVDESDRTGMRAVIKLKKGASAKRILENLYKYSDLECSFGINMVVIADGKPQQMGLLSILKYYVNYQQQIILRRSKFELERAKERAHILEGLIVAVKNIDEVIKIIKSSANTTEAKKNLREKFSLSEAQATAILELRLAKLTKLEITKLEDELKALKAKIKELTAIIGSKKLQMEIVQKELLEIKRKYKEERRTEIVSDAKEVKTESYNDVKPILNYVLGYSIGGTIKKIPEKNFNMSDKSIGENTSKTDVLKLKLNVKSTDSVLIFTNLGNVVKLEMENLPECKYKDKGFKFSDIEKQVLKTEEPVAMFIDNPLFKGVDLYFFTKEGMVKKTSFTEYNLQKNVYQAIKLKEGDTLINVEVDAFDTTMLFVTKEGMALSAFRDDVPNQGRVSGGVKGIKLNDKDELVHATQIGDGMIIVGTNKGNFKRVDTEEVEPMDRYRKGVKIISLGDGEEVVYVGFVKDPYLLTLLDEEDKFHLVDSDQISPEKRVAKGKPIRNLPKKNIVKGSKLLF